ncbi:MAG TPA: lantibiotic dehydratase C-terminal domain-containing protein, partial [Longimicrobium sp.]|nr:lantibiotic dehydratase C-terminal domain-containing protein [Longimicrobium sp.]
AGLLADGLARRFFFVRYLLGGAHLRLRVEVDQADAPAAAARMRHAAAAFLARAPSPQPEDPERIRRRNRGIIVSDPFADQADDVVVEDNTVHDRPVHFEVDRYGGEARFDDSLDLFAVSSVETLRALEADAGGPAGRRAAGQMRLLLRQAWGHAASADELVRLADYGGEMFGATPLAQLLPVADAAFERGRAGTCALVRGELAALARPGGRPALAEAARALRAGLDGVPDGRRHAIGVSHLHMTANRLGLLNRDEVYLCRMLQRAVEAVAAEDPAFWRDAWDAHRAWANDPAPSLRDQAAALLAGFAGQAALATAA